MTAESGSGPRRGPEDAGTSPGVGEVLEAVDAGAFLVDVHGRIVAVSSRAEELLVRRAEDMLGRDAHDLLHRREGGMTVQRSECRLAQALMRGRTDQGEQEWLARGDRTLLPVSWLLTPYRIGGHAAGALLLFHEFRVPEDEESEERRSTGLLGLVERLALLAEATTTLSTTLEVETMLDRLASLTVPRLADWMVVDLLTETGELRRRRVSHREGEEYTRREDLEGPMPAVPENSPMPLTRVLRGAPSTLMGPEDYAEADSGVAAVQRELFRATGIRSAAVVPLRAPRGVLGALTLGRGGHRQPFVVSELALVDDIARRASLAMENAQLFERQRAVAETMQRHLLPQLPVIRGLELAVRYLPAPHASQVGGDWYDVFRLSDGTIALAVGDVVGHDLDAAAGMAQVRNMLRAFAWDHRQPPSAVVSRLDQALVPLSDAPMATMLFAHLERVGEPAGGTWRVRGTNAGHLPPLLVGRDGRTRYVDEGHGLLLGTGVGAVRTDVVVPLPPLTTMVLYTDGLVEERRRSLDEGLAKLRRHAAALATRPLDVFCDLLLERVRPADNDDDIALLAVRVPARGG
ncbi:SpoIIE family protein phosphatase [Streptomyces megasporus]|uniref:SpoIIE family protein phosphatase n=1 Tax=Streptomyces megasporus TaxID=44060 RepID=UPI0004E103F6|nr:SpoIIE family protein phosphatase [Streptomyces megasporus]